MTFLSMAEETPEPPCGWVTPVCTSGTTPTCKDNQWECAGSTMCENSLAGVCVTDLKMFWIQNATWITIAAIGGVAAVGYYLYKRSQKR